MRLVRWDGGDQNDIAIIYTAANKGYRGVLFYDQDSLQQPELRAIASEMSIALVAVKAKDPVEAKMRVLQNLTRIREMVADHDCLLVLARKVRPT